jgi:hypothetical protein
VRLARSLVKATAILTVVAATLGGAVALGSTLFPRPPRDAAEFAARVEAGSSHAPPPEKRTKVERRYVLSLASLCARTRDAFVELEHDADGLTPAGHLRRWRAIVARFDASFRALQAPARYRADAARVAALDGGMLALADAALAARRRGDRETYATKVRAAALLDARFDERMRGLDAPACAGDVSSALSGAEATSG